MKCSHVALGWWTSRLRRPAPELHKMSGLASHLVGMVTGAVRSHGTAGCCNTGTPEGRTHGVSAKPQSAGCCLPVHERPGPAELGQHGDNTATQTVVSRRLCSKSTQQGSAVVLALLHGQAAKDFA